MQQSLSEPVPVMAFDSAGLKQTLLKVSVHIDPSKIDYDLIARKVEAGVSPGITYKETLVLAAQTCAYLNLLHPEYGRLAGNLAAHTLHLETPDTLLAVAEALHGCKDKLGRPGPLLSQQVFDTIRENHALIQAEIQQDSDFTYDYFGFRTLQRSYLLKVDGKVVERPQHLLMRVALGIHGRDLSSAFQTYHAMRRKFFTHATPTLFNAGTPFCQMSSCFLLQMKDDSIDGIYETLAQCAKISKTAGGIGLSVSNIRAKDSYIRGTNGISNGLVPMLRVFNDTARYVDQGGGKRKGSFAIYLEPWHADVFQFLQLKKNVGKEERRARDLFYGLWIPDLFMRRVEQNADWTLFCPNQAPGLDETWGQPFEDLYSQYETEDRGRKSIKARELWQAIVEAQIESGTPYILYKDACNKKSNHQHLGTIKTSNLCTEIVQFVSPDEVAVCNLASLALPMFVEGSAFNFERLAEVTRMAVRNLNRIIDRNHYPVPQAERSNRRHRPIGIGVQGLANVFQALMLPFESEQASSLNSRIFQTIYFAACDQSHKEALKFGPYASFEGSPASKGLLQPDLWGVAPTMYDWASLKQRIRRDGMRNSLLVSPMPTASTSQILGNTQSIDPITSNIFVRRVLAGQFVCVNSCLVQKLEALGLWDDRVRRQLVAKNGSVLGIEQVPPQIQEVFKTTWQISQKAVINLAAGRAPFIDQSQSLNLHLAEPVYSRITAMHFYAWEKGLKTGMYYLRSRPAADPIKFTLELESKKGLAENKKEANRERLQEEAGKAESCSIRSRRLGEQCQSCGS